MVFPGLGSIRRKMRGSTVWFLIVLSVAVLAFVYNFGMPWSDSSSASPSKTVAKRVVKKKLILSWTKFFGIPLDDKYMDNCPELRQKCAITVDRNQHNEADAIVFHPRDMKWTELPPNRSSNQRYLFLMHESPPHTCLDMDQKRNFFNWSFTYRLDSDVPYPYSFLAPMPSARKELNNASILNKSLSPSRALIVWLVSNCNTNSKREMYVDALTKYMPVDIYGACGPLKCPKAVDKAGYNQRSKCEDMIEKQYKFYVAFENSICTDYITEKYYARREYNSVPLVLSRRVSEPLFPPKSFIAVDDFPEGPRQLAEYLKYLDGNDTAYLEYFHWKTVGYGSVGEHPKTGLPFGFCGLCEKLWQETTMETKVYNSADAWWGEKASCDTDLVPRLVAKELAADPEMKKRHPAWSPRSICG